MRSLAGVPSITPLPEIRDETVTAEHSDGLTAFASMG
jgi:hypothetical protein